MPSHPCRSADDHVGRHPAELESAVYYCCLEAVQNATKHGGPAVKVSVTLREIAGQLHFTITDDGPGFDSSKPLMGAGLQNMQDRVGALDGELVIASAPAGGTTISGSVPVGGDSARQTPDVHAARTLRVVP